MKRRRTDRSDSGGGSPSTDDATASPHPTPSTGSHKWSSEEDARLVELVQQFGTNGNWHLIGQHLGGRNARQCRERWSYKLDPTVNKTPFSDDEVLLFDQLLQKYGLAWSIIAKHMPGRCANDLRNRYNSAKRSHDHKKKASKRSSPSSSDKSNVEKGEIEGKPVATPRKSLEKPDIEAGALQVGSKEGASGLDATTREAASVDIVLTEDTGPVPAKMPRMTPIVISRVGEGLAPGVALMHHKRKQGHIVPLSQLAGASFKASQQPAVVSPEPTPPQPKDPTSSGSSPASSAVIPAVSAATCVVQTRADTVDVSRPAVALSAVIVSTGGGSSTDEPGLPRGLDQFRLTLPTAPAKPQPSPSQPHSLLPSHWLGPGLSPLDQSVAVTGGGWNAIPSLSPSKHSGSNLAPFSSAFPSVTSHNSVGYPMPPARAPVLPYNDYTGEYGTRASPAHYSTLCLPHSITNEPPFPRLPPVHTSPSYYIDQFGNYIYPSVMHPGMSFQPMYHEHVSPYFSSPSMFLSSASPYLPQAAGIPVDNRAIALGSSADCGLPQLFRPATSSV